MGVWRDAPAILIISARDDSHLDYVTRHLRAEHIIVDPQELMKGKALSIERNHNASQVRYDGIPLSQIKSIWYRKPKLFSPHHVPVREVAREYSASALNVHFSALFSQFSDAFWLSDYFALQRAEHKPLQLQTAMELGFMVPKTLHTSSGREAHNFLAEHKEVILKPMARIFPWVEKPAPAHFLPATILRVEDNIDFTGLEFAPSIFQQHIRAAADVRVTVVGETIFPAIIHDWDGVEGLGHSKVRDHGINHYRGLTKYKAFPAFPATLTEKCLAYMRAMKLSYCAFDFVLDKADQLWFLEANPNGQWAFIEDEANLPIGKAIADLLQRK